MKGARRALAARLASVMLLSAGVLTACGDEGLRTSAVPPGTVSSSPTATLPAPTVMGTLIFDRVVDAGDRPLATTTPSPGGWSMVRYSTTNYDLYRIDSDGTGLSRLTDGPGVEEHASWAPDGKRIAYGATPAGEIAPYDTSVWVMNADGSGKVRLGPGHAPHWSPDGRRIVYGRMSAGGHEDVWVMNADGSGQRPVVDRPSHDVTPSWGADGRIVFVREGDLYAVRVDGDELVRLTKDAGMVQCQVSPDGATVAGYDARKDRLVAVPLRDDGPAVTLLERASDYVTGGGEPIAAWTLDGSALVLGSSNWGEETGSRLYVVNADGSRLSQVPSVEKALSPAWRPDLFCNHSATQMRASARDDRGLTGSHCDRSGQRQSD